MANYTRSGLKISGPDLSIVEVVWDHLDREPVNIQNIEWNVLQKVWKTMPEEYLKLEHITSDVLKNKGGHSNY